MILLGCLIALAAAVAPRVILVLAWIFADRWVLVWQGDVLAPLLGIIFLPYTTIMYVLVWHPDGIVGFAWVWLLLGVLLDVMKWGHVLTNRKAGMEYAQRYSGDLAPGVAGGTSGSATKDDGSGA
jgi:hypothetical protein